MDRHLALYPVLALGSFLLSAALSRLLAHLGPRLGLVDAPGDGKFHRRPTPLGGGIAIYLGLAPLVLFEPTRALTTLTILGGAGLVALVGLADDLRGVSAPLKFLTLVALTSLLWSLGIGANTTRIAVVDFLITVLWMTGVSSALNAIDNMDGLAAGVAAIASACFLVIALQSGQWLLGALSAALLGATSGFLLCNFPPARIFMGDTGSFLLGFLLATLGVVGDWNSNEVIAAVIPVLVLGLPIFDLGFTVVRRHLNGVTRTPLEALSHCGTDHLSHRLVGIGLSPRDAVLFLYLIAASFGISALSLRHAASTVALLHLLQAMAIATALVPLLNLAEPVASPRRRPAGRRAVAWLLLLLSVSGVLSLLSL